MADAEGHLIWHQGVTPDVVVDRASDVPALGPDQVRALTPAEGEVKDPSWPGRSLAHAPSSGAASRPVSPPPGG